MKKIQKTITLKNSNKPTEEQIKIGMDRILEEQFEKERLIKIMPLKTLVSDLAKEYN